MWYVIQTLKGRERKILEEIKEYIAEEDEEVFILENEKMFKHHGKWEPDRVPLFAGYIFADTDEPEEFDKRLYEKYRYIRLMTVGDVITPIRPEEELFLRRLGGDSHIVQYSEGFKVGDKIIIEDGPLKGLEGSILRFDRHNREATIKLTMFGKETTTTLGLGVVKVI